MTEIRFFDVLVPQDGDCHGYDLRKGIMAGSPAEAIEKACAEWFGGDTYSGATEGVYLVAEQGALVAFEVVEARRPEVKAQVSLP